MPKPTQIIYFEEKFGVEFYPSQKDGCISPNHYAHQIDSGSWLVYMVKENVFNIVGFFLSSVVRHNLSEKEVGRELKKLSILKNFK